MTPKDKISKAMIKLLLHHPFYATLLMRLNLIEDKSHRSGWTNGRAIGYSPEWIDSLLFEQVIGFLIHEALHLVFLHDIRRNWRDFIKFNEACDYAINLMLVEMKFQLPPNGLCDARFNNMTADAIYNLLPDPPPDYQLGWGEVRDQPGADGKSPASAGERQFQEQQRKMDIEKARQTAKRAGKMPAGMERLIDDILEPKLDWKTVLRRFISTNARNDYAWYPPNRRFIHRGLYLPSLRSNEIEKIALAIDTSGSLSREELAQFNGELNAILEEVDTTIVVMYCDSKLYGKHQENDYEPDIFRREDLPLLLEMRGGGGTSFRPPFEYLESVNDVPTCFIYLTDMWCHDFPDPAPEYPVLWVQIGDYNNDPPFGELLTLEKIDG
uniref:Metal-dependent peptidase n=1 Tax=viral metagenome TaxID=1070528 RepID=A0A6M3JPX6_9ZZZZ